MKLAIVGGRDFNDYELMKSSIKKFITDNIDLIVSGGASGADSLAEKYSEDFDIPIKVYEADWETNGKKAGFLRNATIIRNSDIVIAFWDEKSKGTKDSIEKAIDMGKRLIIINYEN